MANVVFSAQRSNDPKDKPPDPLHLDTSSGRKPSFRDMVMGDKVASPARDKSDLLAQKLLTISHVGGNRLLPMVMLNDKLFDTLCEPWRDTLVVKLLGKTISYVVMKERLQHLWKSQGGFEILDVDNIYFMVKFDLP